MHGIPGRVLRRGLPVFSFILLLILSASSATAATNVERVSYSSGADGRALVVRFKTSEPVQAFREPVVTGDGRVELVIFNAELSASYRAARPPAPIQDVRVEPVRHHLRFTFSLEPGTRVLATAYRDRATDDLLLGLQYLTDIASPLPVASLPEPGVRYPGKSTPAAQTERSGAVSTAAMRWRLDTIVIDAGHGGHDHGAEAHGVREKDICLAVAMKLGRLVEEEMGVDVVYTRRTDRFVELKERGRIANEAGGKLFISLHANAAHSPVAAGTETFFLGMHKSDAARNVMERENSVVHLESDPTHYTDMTDEALIIQTLAHSAFMRKSEELASLVENEVGGYSRAGSRGVKQAGFYVLWSASMPSILVEMGFVTNRREAQFLASEEGQDYVANAILRAVQTFRDRYERDLHLVSP